MIEDYIITKRLKELCPKGYLTSQQNFLLLQEYAQDRQNGVSPEDSEARTLLILGNTKLICYFLVKKLHIMDAEGSDEFSVARIGLMKAIDTFKLDAGVTFSTHACIKMRYEIQVYYRKLKYGRFMPEQQIFLEDYINDEVKEGGRLRLLDTICDDEDFVKQIQNKCLYDSIVDKMKYLTYNEAYIIVMSLGLFGNEKHTQLEIADLLNISRTYVSMNFTSGLKKLRVLTTQDEYLTPTELRLKNRVLWRGPSNDLVNEINGTIADL